MSGILHSLGIGLLFCFSSPVEAQFPQGSTLGFQVGNCEESYYGASLRGAGDVNGDGIEDWFSSETQCIYFEWIGYLPTNEGSIHVRSGGAPSYAIFSYPYDSGDSSFGGNLGAAGDVNADGFGDFLIAAPYDNVSIFGSTEGKVFLYSGQDGSLLATFLGLPGKPFGMSLAKLGDVNRDGHDDFAVTGGASFTYNTDFIRVLSGKTYATLYQIDTTPQMTFGQSMAIDGTGDLNGDGYPDFVAGGTDFLFAFSGRNGALLWQWDYSNAGSTTYEPPIAGVGDVNGDGFADVAVGLMWLTGSGCLNGGPGAAVISGSDGEPLHFLKVCNGSGISFSTATVSRVGDVDGDGGPDVLVGVPGDSVYLGGSARVFSGKTGKEILVRALTQPGAQLGSQLVAMGDLNADGHADFAAAAPYLNFYDEDVGEVIFYSGCPGYVWNLGGGCAGSGGMYPKLAAPGCPMPGDPLTVAVSDALGGAFGVLTIGLDWGPTVLPGNCILLVNSIVNSIPFAVSSEGAWTMTATIPRGVANDTTIVYQAFVFDPAAAGGMSATNGVWMIVEDYQN